MNPTEQPRGNFTMNFNRKHTTNPELPPVTGRVSTPEDPDTEYSYAAFKHIDAKGVPYWIGPVQMHHTVGSALDAKSERGTHFVAIRKNGFRIAKTLDDGSPNAAYAALSPAEQAHEDSKPAFWGSWTRTAGEPQLRMAAWDREPTRYGPWASGNTQYPISKEQAAADLHAPEPVSTRRKTKGTDHERA